MIHGKETTDSFIFFQSRIMQLTIQQTREIKEMRAQGMTILQIAEKIGCCKNTVLRYSLPYEPKGLKRSHRKYYENNREHIIARVKRNYRKRKDEKRLAIGS